MLYEDYFKTPKSNASINEKLALIKANYRTARELEAKIKTQNITKQTPDLAEEYIIPEYDSPNKSPKINSKLIKTANELSLLDTSTYSDEELMAKLKEYLKCLEFSNWELRLKLYEEIVSYQEMFIEAQSKEDLIELKTGIKELYRKINLLKDLEEEQELLETASSNNNIFFLMSSRGNIYFLENIRKSVPKEYYNVFLILLESIKNGKFIGLKKLNDLSYFEVKLFKVRITFAKLSNNSYIIIDGFMKKEYTSNYYKSMLANKNKQYLEMKDKYLNSISKEEFITIHNNYYNDIIDYLKNTKDLEEDHHV